LLLSCPKKHKIKELESDCFSICACNLGRYGFARNRLNPGGIFFFFKASPQTRRVLNYLEQRKKDRPGEYEQRHGQFFSSSIGESFAIDSAAPRDGRIIQREGEIFQSQKDELVKIFWKSHSGKDAGPVPPEAGPNRRDSGFFASSSRSIG
jgi:hypothetical protein